MVPGIEKFREFFKGFEDNYVLIGGVAFRHWMTTYGGEPRATKDLDLIILSHKPHQEFIDQLVLFLKEGNYQHKTQSNGKVQNYRFTKPKAGYPEQIELMIDRDDRLPLEQVKSHHQSTNDEEISAIMLDSNYYDLVKDERVIVDGISIISKDVLILLKMKAWINFRQDLKNGRKVKKVDLTKHRSDVLMLVETISDFSTLLLSSTVINDIKSFNNELRQYNSESEEYPLDVLNNYIDLIEKYFIKS